MDLKWIILPWYDITRNIYTRYRAIKITRPSIELAGTKNTDLSWRYSFYFILKALITAKSLVWCPRRWPILTCWYLLTSLRVSVSVQELIIIRFILLSRSPPSSPGDCPTLRSMSAVPSPVFSPFPTSSSPGASSTCSRTRWRRRWTRTASATRWPSTRSCSTTSSPLRQSSAARLKYLGLTTLSGSNTYTVVTLTQ